MLLIQEKLFFVDSGSSTPPGCRLQVPNAKKSVRTKVASFAFGQRSPFCSPKLSGVVRVASDEPNLVLRK